MSGWHVLELSNATNDSSLPQLLVKTEFGAETYTVFLTDLNNIWSEELDLAAIVERASQQESPIEVSKQDTTQLAILLDHVRKSLTGAEHTTCRILPDDADGIILSALTILPEPLDSLRWKFYLKRKTSIALGNELVLPLLVSSYIQHERVNSLISIITEKDKVIARLLDQFESSNLDLATVFPSVGGTKPGRRFIKREQAARHVPALQPFQDDAWKADTEHLKDFHISTLGLFQEALSQCAPRVPPRMKLKDGGDPWWTSIRDLLDSSESDLKSKLAKPTEIVVPTTSQADSSEDEMEDEFETHEHFKPRQREDETTEDEEVETTEDEEDEAIEDEEDLDAPPKSQSQSQARICTSKQPARVQSPDSLPSSPKLSSSPAQKPKGFRIGGVKKKVPVISPPRALSPGMKIAQKEAEVSDDVHSSIPTRSKISSEATATINAKPSRKPFKIGGKQKASSEIRVPNSSPRSPHKASKSKCDVMSGRESLVEPGPSEALPIVKAKIETKSLAEEHEETAEEKAGRKRQELKRKNEELAKKQAQNKKKKRF